MWVYVQCVLRTVAVYSRVALLKTMGHFQILWAVGYDGSYSDYSKWQEPMINIQWALHQTQTNAYKHHSAVAAATPSVKARSLKFPHRPFSHLRNAVRIAPYTKFIREYIYSTCHMLSTNRTIKRVVLAVSTAHWFIGSFYISYAIKCRGHAERLTFLPAAFRNCILILKATFKNKISGAFKS